jgi:hypothetical protein
MNFTVSCWKINRPRQYRPQHSVVDRETISFKATLDAGKAELEILQIKHSWIFGVATRCRTPDEIRHHGIVQIFTALVQRIGISYLGILPSLWRDQPRTCFNGFF